MNHHSSSLSAGQHAGARPAEAHERADLPQSGPPHTVARCPFHDGAATLDLLLAELDPSDVAMFDAALDLRSLCAAREDAAACVAQLYHLRALLDGRHYLAFYRVRCWARRAFQIEARASRTSEWHHCPLPLDGARIDELVNAALAALAEIEGSLPTNPHVRFTFAPAA